MTPIFLAALPQELIEAIAGLAFLGTIGKSLATALASPQERDAALITFLVTASGVAILGVGSAFWELSAGLFTRLMSRVRPSSDR